MNTLHDFHIHTHLSSCAQPTALLGAYLENAKAYGLSKLGIADHLWDEGVPGAPRWYLPQNVPHVMQIREEAKDLDTQRVQFFFGCEAEYCWEGHCVALTEESAQQMDFILAPNSHTHITMPKEYYDDYQKHVDFMLTAFWEIVTGPLAKYVTAVPHPFRAVGCPYDLNVLLRMITDRQYAECFAAARENQVALEINPFRFYGKSREEIANDEMMRLFAAAKAAGCKFIIGTDAHAPMTYNPYIALPLIIEVLGLTDDEFLDWVR